MVVAVVFYDGAHYVILLSLAVHLTTICLDLDQVAKLIACNYCVVEMD